MKKNIVWFVVAAVMIVTLMSVTGASAAPARGDGRPPMIPVLDPGMYVMNPSAYPAYPGGRMQTYSVVMVTQPGTLCFINTFDSVREFGHIRAAAIRQLDGGKWVNNQLPRSRNEVSVGNGVIRCAEVTAGIWAFQGW